MKKLIAGLAALVLVLGVSGTAYAATVDSVNDDSFVSIFSKWKIFSTMTNSNDASIDNHISATASSGNNSFTSSDDQTGTKLATGDATTAVVVDNTANSNSLTMNVQSADGTNDNVSNVNDGSSADVTTKDYLTEDMTNANSINVDNCIKTESETGANSFVSGDSLTDASATTGNAESGSGVTNLFNFNIKDIVRTIRSSF